MNWKTLVIWVLAILAFWGLSWGVIVHSGALNDWEQRGQFGSMFGAIGALFTGLAFAGIVWTIFHQQRQRFESAYLQLMGDIWDVEDTLSVEHRGQSNEGYDAICCVAEKTAQHVGAQEAVDSLNQRPGQSSTFSAEELNSLLTTAGFDDARRVKNELRPFLHSVKVSLDFLDRNSLTRSEKKRYSDWIRGYFGEQELAVIGLLAMSDSRLKELIEKYGILYHLDAIDPLRRQFFRRRYAASAFKE